MNNLIRGGIGLVGVIVLIIGIIFAFIILSFIGIWLRARLAQAPVMFRQLIGMKLRRVPVGMIVDSRVTAVKAGIELSSDQLEAHYLAGGNVEQTVLALIAARKAGIALDLLQAPHAPSAIVTARRERRPRDMARV